MYKVFFSTRTCHWAFAWPQDFQESWTIWTIWLYEQSPKSPKFPKFPDRQIWPGQCNTHLVAVTQEQDLRWLEGMSNFRTNVNKHLRTSGPLHEQFPSKVAHVTAVRTMPPHKQVLYKSGELILYDYWWSPRISVDFWWLLQMIRSLAGTTTSKSLQLLQTRPHGPKIYTKYHGTTETERKKYQLAATCYIHSFWTSLENHLFWDCCGSASRIGLLMIAAI